VKFLDLMSVADPAVQVPGMIESFQPDVIGVSIRNIDDQNMAAPHFLVDQARETIQLCRGITNAPIVLGGAGYSIFPQSVLDYVEADYGIRGEGEKAFPELVRRLENQGSLEDLPGLYSKDGRLPTAPCHIRRLDELIWPHMADWLTHAQQGQGILLPIQTRRGCPMNCLYCSTSAIEGSALRKSSPDRVADWIADQVASGFGNLYFTDNLFNLPPSFAKLLCQGLIDRRVKAHWRCIMYPARVDDELVGLMARAGCVGVSLGFEHGSPRIMRALNKRFDCNDVIHACKLLKEHGIPVMGFLLLGGPGETKETVLESLVFADRLALASMRLTVGIRIYPHTGLARLALKQGLISSTDGLLKPHFYLEPGLDSWIRNEVRKWVHDRPGWIM
jgi:radical SAM superfamily enzyme YgiQ (UPF0313 family)